MPIYEYQCTKCNKIFAVLQRVGASEKDTSCPDCGSGEVRKKVSTFCCAPGGDHSSSSSYPRFSGGG